MTTQPLQSSAGLLKNTENRLEELSTDVDWGNASLRIISAYLETYVSAAARGGEDGKIIISFHELLKLKDGIDACIHVFEKALS